MGFSVQQKVRKAKEYAVVREHGKRINCGAFLMQLCWRKSDPEGNTRRMGVIASRKVGNAVKRNYAKRIFREIFYLNQQNLPEGTDLVIIVYPNHHKFTFKELETQFIKGCQAFSNISK